MDVQGHPEDAADLYVTLAHPLEARSLTLSPSHSPRETLSSRNADALARLHPPTDDTPWLLLRNPSITAQHPDAKSNLCLLRVRSSGKRDLARHSRAIRPHSACEPLCRQRRGTRSTWRMRSRRPALFTEAGPSSSSRPSLVRRPWLLARASPAGCWSADNGCCEPIISRQSASRADCLGWVSSLARVLTVCARGPPSSRRQWCRGRSEGPGTRGARTL